MIETTNVDVRYEKAIVARGRTVIVPSRTKTVDAGETPEGKPIVRPVQESFGPGSEIEVPANEVPHLRALGHIVDPNAKTPPVIEPATGRVVGPQFISHGSGPIGFSFRS